MTEQPLIKPGAEDAEALMDQAATDMRAHMDTALARLSAHYKRIAEPTEPKLITSPQQPSSPTRARPA